MIISVMASIYNKQLLALFWQEVYWYWSVPCQLTASKYSSADTLFIVGGAFMVLCTQEFWS